MRFGSGGQGEDDKKSLSFSPTVRPYKPEEGKVVGVQVVTCYKTYHPEKVYVSLCF